MQNLVQSLINERSPENRVVPPAADQQRRQSFAIGRFALFAIVVIVSEAVAMLLNAQSYKLAGVSLVWLPNGLLIGALLCSPKNNGPRIWPWAMPSTLYLISVPADLSRPRSFMQHLTLSKSLPQ